MFKTIKTAAYTLKDWTMSLVAPIRSSFATEGESHKFNSVDLKRTKQELDELKAHQTKGAKKGKSRNIYLTDLDDTFIDWKHSNTSSAAKLKHRLIYRPDDEPVDHFHGAREFIENLNSKNVRTAIVSNKDHHKLVKQAHHNKWDLLFDEIIGHDRINAISKRKSSGYLSPSHKLPEIAIERLLGEPLRNGMEPVNIVFAGDRPDQDIATAKALDKILKRYNKESSCTSVLFNSRGYTQKDISWLPKSQQPDRIAGSYEDLKIITDEVFAEKSKDTHPPQTITNTNHAEKVKTQSKDNFIGIT